VTNLSKKDSCSRILEDLRAKLLAARMTTTGSLSGPVAAEKGSPPDSKDWEWQRFRDGVIKAFKSPDEELLVRCRIQFDRAWARGNSFLGDRHGSPILHIEEYAAAIARAEDKKIRFERLSPEVQASIRQDERKQRRYRREYQRERKQRAKVLISDLASGAKKLEDLDWTDRICLTQTISKAPFRKRKGERIDTKSDIRTVLPADQVGSDLDSMAGEHSSSPEIGSQSAADEDG